MYIGMVKQLDGCSLDSVDSVWTAPWVFWAGVSLLLYYRCLLHIGMFTAGFVVALEIYI